MREPAFIKQNADKWKQFERLLDAKDRTHKTTPDEQADLFVQLTDDLSYAKTFYPKSKVTAYLNGLTARVHRTIYRNKKEESGRFIKFWTQELPLLMYSVRRELLLSFLLFSAAILLGVVSARYDATFANLILGDSYINMTLENIKRGDPMGVYKSAGQTEMFLAITFNNIRVSFLAFAMGVFCSFGTAYVLFNNGVMLGAFQYFFYERGLFWTSFLTIWIHGTLEISAIVIAGCAGFVMGNSILFPQTYTRLESLMMGARKAVKIVIGLVPIFIAAGFLESFVTRHTEMPTLSKAAIIGGSAAFIVWYFVVYPMMLASRAQLKAAETLEAEAVEAPIKDAM